MSRSGYSDDMEDMWAHIRWRGAVNSAISGKRGQQALRETLAALDAMPVKELVAGDLVDEDGRHCTLGVLAAARGMDVSGLDPEEPEAVAAAFGLAPALVREVVYENDEFINDWNYVQADVCGPIREHSPHWERRFVSVYVPDTKARQRRWAHMRNWVASQIKEKP